MSSIRCLMSGVIEELLDCAQEEFFSPIGFMAAFIDYSSAQCEVLFAFGNGF